MVGPPETIEVERRRFYDGGLPPGADGTGGRPPDPGADVSIVLDRRLDDGAETFRLQRRIAYADRHCGEIVVPPDFEGFATDLTSVPALFTWLVPKTGSHLPAALIHDGLVGDPTAPTYVSTDGKVVDRVEADRIFRDGMADTGTGLVRRWLVWTAVTLATIWEARDTSPRVWVRRYYRAVMALTLLAVVVTGYSATADLFDRADRWWGATGLPWIPEHSFGLELLFGVAGAVVVGVGLGLLWGRFVRAGMIAGVALALLIHVTLALGLVSAGYLAAEQAARRLGATAFVVLLGVGFAAMLVLVVVAPAA